MANYRSGILTIGKRFEEKHFDVSSELSVEDKVVIRKHLDWQVKDIQINIRRNKTYSKLVKTKVLLCLNLNVEQVTVINQQKGVNS